MSQQHVMNSMPVLNTGLALTSGLPYKVADMSDSEVAFGRKELELALHEMPGLEVLMQRHSADKPLAGARIMGSLHMTIQTGVLIETLIALGAEVRWVSCNIFSTQDHAAAAVVAGPDGSAADPKGPAVYAWKGETLEEYWWCTYQALDWPEHGGPNLILDDGGDATLLVHLGAELEEQGKVADPNDAESDEHRVILELLKAVREERGQLLAPDGRDDPRCLGRDHHGCPPTVSAAGGGYPSLPAINVNDSVTKSKFDNLYGCRHSLVDAIMRSTDVLITEQESVGAWLVTWAREAYSRSAASRRASRSPKWTPSARCKRACKASTL